jgi:hypothetical protein
MEGRFVKKMEDSIIPLQIDFSQSYRVVPSVPRGWVHKNIAQIYGGRRSTWIRLGPVFL